MIEFYTKLGFNENPFSRFSAEEEVDYLSDIYLKPRYFETLLNDISNGSSRLIFGNRGSGKSALILEIEKELENRDVLTILIQKYDSIPLKNNEKHMVIFLIQEILKKLIVYVDKNPFLIKKLKPYQKEIFSTLIRDFYKPLSRREYESSYNRVTKYKQKNFLKYVCNSVLCKPANILINAGVEITSDTVRKSFGLPEITNNELYKKYIPDFNFESLSKKERDQILNNDYGLLKDMLNELVCITKELGYSKVAVFFDRIDEFKKLDGKVDRIVDFTIELLKDTDLMYEKDLSLVFSIWTEISRKLNERGIRYDKFKPVDVSWTEEDMEKLLEKRLTYFSKVKPYAVNQLVTDSTLLKEIYTLCNKSPRDAIRLFSAMYDEQSVNQTNNKYFTEDNIRLGMLSFCKQYDYYSIYPSKIGTKEDIKSIINKLLRVGKVEFKSADLVAIFKFSSQSANNYIKIMKNYSLIKDDEAIASVTKNYLIKEPKIHFLISNNIKQI